MENEQTIQKNPNQLSKESSNYMSLKHMKSLIVLVVSLLAVGCETPLPQRPKAKPVKELTPEQKQKALWDSVVGEYEHKDRNHKYVFLENGTAEGYVHGNRQKAEEYKWSIVDGEIYVHWYDERIGQVYRINTDKSITLIVSISDGKRTAQPKDKQYTYKRIK